MQTLVLNELNASEEEMNKENKLVPKLRFPQFEKDNSWADLPLRNYIEEFQERSSSNNIYEVLTSSRFGLIRQKDYYDNSRITGRENAGFNIIPQNYITYRSRSDNRRFYFNENNLGIIGLISSYYPVFRIVGGSNKFFVELLSNYVDHVGKHSVGTSQTVLSINELKRIKLPVPLSEDEQQKIADCLSSLDELVTAETEKLGFLKEYKRGLIQELFPIEGNKIPKLRFPEFKHSEEWETDKLSGDDVAYLVNKKISFEKLDLATYVSTENLLTNYSGVVIASRLPSSGAFTEYQKGDILLSNIRPYLKKIWLSDRAGATSNDVIVIRAKTKLNASFLGCLLINDDFINYIMKGAEGVKMPRGDKDSIKQYQIVFPNKHEQQKIVNCLSSLDEHIASQAKKVENLKLHKKGLLQQLFPTIN